MIACNTNEFTNDRIQYTNHFLEYTQRSFDSAHHSFENTHRAERWGAGVETQKNVRGEVGGWGRVPFIEPYAPSLSTIYDGA